MTTEHLHHERSDVDTSVVEYPAALKTTINSTPNETATSVEAYGEVSILLPEPTAPAPPSEKAHQESAGSQEVLSDFSHEAAAPLETVSTSVPFSDKQYAPAELSPAPAIAEDVVSGTIKEEQQAQKTTDTSEVPSNADLQEKSASSAVLAKANLEIMTLQQGFSEHSSQEQKSQEPSVSETTPYITVEQIEAVPAKFVSPFTSETERKPLLGTKAEEIDRSQILLRSSAWQRQRGYKLRCMSHRQRLSRCSVR